MEPDTAATPLEKELAAESAAQDGDSPAPATSPSPGPASAPKPKGADDVLSVMKKLPSMKPEEQQAALLRLQQQFGSAESNPVLPTPDIDLAEYLALSPENQAAFSETLAALFGKLAAIEVPEGETMDLALAAAKYEHLFWLMTWIGIGCAALAFIVAPSLRRMMHGVK